jgi:hypothetical protein
MLSQYLLEMTTPEDWDLIGALSTDSADESLSECVRSRRSNGRLDHLDVRRRPGRHMTGADRPWTTGVQSLLTIWLKSW